MLWKVIIYSSCQCSQVISQHLQLFRARIPTQLCYCISAVPFRTSSSWSSCVCTKKPLSTQMPHLEQPALKPVIPLLNQMLDQDPLVLSHLIFWYFFFCLFVLLFGEESSIALIYPWMNCILGCYPSKRWLIPSTGFSSVIEIKEI